MLQQVLIAALAASLQTAPVEPEAESRIIPSEMCDGFFFVPITLAPREGYPEDRTLWYIYDTGASSTYTDPDSIERVSGIQLDNGDRANITDATAGPLTFHRLPSRIRDLDHLSHALGREIDGILAYDVFGSSLVTLDYQSNEIRLTPGELPRPDDQAIFSTNGRDDRPWLDIRFSNRTRRMLLDSGAGRTGLTVRRINRFELDTDPVPVGASTRFSRIEVREGARASEDAFIGPHRMIAPTLETTPGSELIGVDVMRHFIWTFDFENERVRMERHTPDRPIEFDPIFGHGMVLGWHEDGFQVREILPGTPASHQDIRPGDVVTHMNGRAVSERGCRPPSNERIALRISRDGAIVELDFALYPLVD